MARLLYRYINLPLICLLFLLEDFIQWLVGEIDDLTFLSMIERDQEWERFDAN